MSPDLPPIPPDLQVTVETVCETPFCVDLITVYHVCGETVYVGPGVPNYFVMPGASCAVLPGKMEGVRREPNTSPL